MVNNKSNFSDDGLRVTFLILYIRVHFTHFPLCCVFTQRALKGLEHSVCCGAALKWCAMLNIGITQCHTE